MPGKKGVKAALWSDEEREWLAENYPHYHNRELAEMHAERFPDRQRRTHKAINTKAKEWGLKKRPGFNKNPRRFWTDEKREWFVSFVPGHTQDEISAEHERLFGTPLRRSQISNGKIALDVKSGTKGGCFPKGHTPHNKGKTWDELGYGDETRSRMLRTSYKPGNMPHNALDKPIGYERITRDGYVEVKVAERPTKPNRNDNFKMKHHLVYEEHHGAIPEGCNVVFADHDTLNFDPDNLVAIPRSLWSAINALGLAYRDAETLEVAMNIAKLSQARYAAKMRPRSCVVCGETFEPRAHNQKRCDECIKSHRMRKRKQ